MRVSISDTEAVSRRRQRRSIKHVTAQHPFRVIAVASVAAAVALGTTGAVAYANTHSSITLDVDGRVVEVSTFASTVGEVLADYEITVGEHDIVAPTESSPLPDGGAVVVRHGREVSAEINGRTTTFWTTALTADDAAAQLATRGEGARLVASRSATDGREVLGLPLSEHVSVKVAVDGVVLPVQVMSVDFSVDDVLASSNIVVADNDKVVVSPADQDSVTITVHRIVQSKRNQDVKVAFTKVEKEDPNLEKGTKKVTQEGKYGITRATFLTVLQDGKEVRRSKIAGRVLTKPVQQITSIGTKPKEKSSSGSSSGSGDPSISPSGSSADLNWAALAQCESGGNPTIVSASGKYHGLYQFSVSTWQAVGGSGLPSKASAAEQTKRAQILYERSGAGQWPHCGSRLFQ